MNIKILKQNLFYSTNELKSDFCSFLNFIKNNKLTVILCWFFLLLSYGIKLFWYSIGIDTELIINDYKNCKLWWLSINRAGLVITKKLFGLVTFNPYVANFLMLCMMFLFLMLCSFLFYYISKKFENESKCVFVLPCIFITYPLFVEQFNFTLQCFEVSFAIVLIFLAAFLITKWVFDFKNVLHLFIGILYLVWSIWSYQATLFLYVSTILAVFILAYVNNLRYKKEKENKNFFRLASVKYALTLFLAYALYYLLNKLLKCLMHAGSAVYLDNMIYWGTKSYAECIKNIISYILSCKLYCVAAFLFITFCIYLLVKESSNRLLFLASIVFLVFSPFILSVYLGCGAIPRSQFSLQFVLAFFLYFIVQQLNKHKIAALFVTMYSLKIAFANGYSSANLLYSEYVRYNYDVSMANKISERIDRLAVSNISDVPVVFTGILKLPSWQKGNCVGSSFFEWDSDILGGTSWRILGFMKTIGYDYKKPTEEDCKKAKEIAKTMKPWPSPEAIKYEDGIIVVKLSES